MHEIEIGSQRLQIDGDEFFQQINQQVVDGFVAGFVDDGFTVTGYVKTARCLPYNAVVQIRAVRGLLENPVVGEYQPPEALIMTSNPYAPVKNAKFEIGGIQCDGIYFCFMGPDEKKPC